MKKRFIFSIVAVIATVSPAYGQSYMDRAESFSSDSLGRLVRNQDLWFEWYGNDGEFFSYSDETPDGREFFLKETKTGKSARFSERQKLRENVDSILSGRGCSVQNSNNTFNHGRDWKKSWTSDSLFAITAHSHNLCLLRYNSTDRSIIDSIRLSSDGEPYRSFATGGNSKDSKGEGSAVGCWIGDTHKFLTVREDQRSVGTLSLINSLSDPRPKTITYKFPMPSDTAVTRFEVFLSDADSAAMYRIDAGRKDQTFLLPRFSKYVTAKNYAYLLRINRTRDTLELVRINALDRKTDVLISEPCPPHLNEQLFGWHLLEEGREILWWSERSGKGRWYLYDGNGRLKKALTPEGMVAGHIERIDTAGRNIIYEGYGFEEGINPNYRFYYRATFSGRNTLITPGNGNHDIIISPSGKYIYDTYSRMDLPPRHKVVSASGKVLYDLPSCDVSALQAKGWKAPEVVKVMAADSVTELYGVVYTPFDIEPGKKYPIISNVYPGPQTDLVPQSFSLDDNGNQSLAQLGFVVVNFSYRGSNPLRGRDFYTFGYGNLRDYALEDDYAAICQTARMYPYADTTRVGIYGHSGGGFMAAAAMLTRPDFYKVGVASSGNHDNNIYTQWWGETFHGVKYNPDKGCYECKIPTTVELAANLKGRLLLVTGDMDKNVHPANTLRLADALIRNGKRFDMMIIPGADHGLPVKYHDNLIRYYFTEHLLGLPQKDIDIVRHK